MHKTILFFCCIAICLATVACGRQDSNSADQPIDRHALVTRHNVHVTAMDTLASLSVGNGEFAYTVDATGVQSFPEFYSKGIPLGTQSQWGWHSFPNPEEYQFSESLREYPFHGSMRSYAIQPKFPPRNVAAVNYVRSNPHRLHLGNIGFEMYLPDGRRVTPADVKDIDQTLDLWTGEITSRFRIGNEPVYVSTVCHQEQDAIAVKVTSKLLSTGQLKINFRFPYPTGAHADDASDWNSPDLHTSQLVRADNHQAVIRHTLDTTTYYVSCFWDAGATLQETAPHYFVLAPENTETIALTCRFTARNTGRDLTYGAARKSSADKWQAYWTEGGAVDFSGSTDPRAAELERRVILSQYLMAIQCAGSMPPQETGLTYNSWYGKFHLEMHWWHAAHFALWGHIDQLEKSLGWYNRVAWRARQTAKRQGYDGLRWQKMTYPAGEDAPSSVGSFLIWQQPHYIYFAELCYRAHPDEETLDKYKDLLFETAEFMASFAEAGYDSINDRYLLGPGLIPAQECYDNSTTFNPPFELAYWRWGLTTAQKWKERLELPRDERWDRILAKLSALPVKDGVYLGAESIPEGYTRRTHVHDHPAVFGALGYLPQQGNVDIETMNRTFDLIWDIWQWADTWGWDFPLTAMTATRLGRPDKAIDALFLNPATNTYLINGHNFQDKRLRLYLPGNGSLLTAVAMMCGGYDGCTEEMPGIPKDGTWKVRAEGLQPMP